MLFITNRMPEKKSKGECDGEWVFDLNENCPNSRVSFCRREIGKEYNTEITDKDFMRQLKDDPAEQILFYIHGYNKSPDEVFSIVDDIQGIADSEKGKNFVRVVPVIWPADANLPVIPKYYSDRSSAVASQVSFSQALQLFIDWKREGEHLKPCCKPINIFAHSMGNRVFRETLLNLANEHLRNKMLRLFRCVFMSSADIVNENLEKDKAGRYISDSSERVVSYFASDDFSLFNSSIINLDQVASLRMGQSGPESMCDVDTNVYAINCDSFNNIWDPITGHNYHRTEMLGDRHSPLFLHALDVMDDDKLRVRDADPRTRKGRLSV